MFVEDALLGLPTPLRRGAYTVGNAIRGVCLVILREDWFRISELSDETTRL